MNVLLHDGSAVTPLLSSLADLTEQREQDALSLSMGRAIRDLTDARTVTLYRVSTVEAQRMVTPVAAWLQGQPSVKTEGLDVATPLASMPMFNASLSSREMSRHQMPGTDGMTLVMPLSGHRDQIEGFFLIEGVCAYESVERVLLLLLEIYRNFLDLLRDNQHDLLTGLLNRKTFDAKIGNILYKLSSPHHRKGDVNQGQYCLAILDIDHFKRINDNFGHLYGDEVLLLMSNMMQESFREDDALFRFGGEEFVVLIKDVDLPLTERILERFRAKVEARNFPQVGAVTISIGATAIKPGELPPQILDRADRALYFAKGNGRNQIHLYETLVEQGLIATSTPSEGSIELF